MRSGVIDENPTHHVGGYREELGTVVPLDASLIDQPEESVVDQRGGRQRMVRTLSPKVASREPSQFVINGLNQAIAGHFFPVAHGDEESRDVSRLAHGFFGRLFIPQATSMRPPWA
jgi:hypothetical protein